MFNGCSKQSWYDWVIHETVSSYNDWLYKHYASVFECRYVCAVVVKGWGNDQKPDVWNNNLPDKG